MPEKTKKWWSALAVLLIDCSYERVGNPLSAKDGHFGVTGWKVQHVTFEKGAAIIKYVGKSGVSHKKRLDDAICVKMLKEAIKGKRPNDTILNCTADDVNEYLKPFDITAKDIRGLHANREVQKALKAIRSKGGKLPEDKKEREKKLKEEFKKAVEQAAEAVGHEPTTLKNQYLVPGVEENFLKDGTVKENLAKQKTASFDHPSATCPVCGQHYKMTCRCKIGEKRCANDHQWVWCPEHKVAVVIEGDTHGVGMPWEGCRCAFGTPMPKAATKTHAEKEDEEAERLVRPTPKKNPPRNDLRREHVEDDDTRGETNGADDDDDLSLNYKRVAARWLAAKRHGKSKRKQFKPAPPPAPKKKEDLVTVRRKEDDKIVQVTEDTLKSTPGNYEKVEDEKKPAPEGTSGKGGVPEKKPSEAPAAPKEPEKPKDSWKSDVGMSRNERGKIVGVDTDSLAFEDVADAHGAETVEAALWLRAYAKGERIDVPKKVMKSPAWKSVAGQFPIATNPGLAKTMLDSPESPYGKILGEYDVAVEKFSPPKEKAGPEKPVKEKPAPEPEPTPAPAPEPEKKPEPAPAVQIPPTEEGKEPEKPKEPPAVPSDAPVQIPPTEEGKEPAPQATPEETAKEVDQFLESMGEDGKSPGGPSGPEGPDPSEGDVDNLIQSLKADPETKSLVAKVLKKFPENDPETRRAVAQAFRRTFDETMAELKDSDTGDFEVSEDLANELGDALKDPSKGEDSEDVGRQLALHAIAKKLADPTNIDGVGLAPEEDEPDEERLTDRGARAVEFYGKFPPNFRREAARQLAARTQELRAKGNNPHQVAELGRIAMGLQVAAIVNDDFKDKKNRWPRSIPRPAPAFGPLVKVFHERGDMHALVSVGLDPDRGLATDAGKDYAHGLFGLLDNDDDLFSALGGSSGPWGGLIATFSKSQNAKADEWTRGFLKEMAVGEIGTGNGIVLSAVAAAAKDKERDKADVKPGPSSDKTPSDKAPSDGASPESGTADEEVVLEDTWSDPVGDSGSTAGEAADDVHRKAQGRLKRLLEALSKCLSKKDKAQSFKECFKTYSKGVSKVRGDVGADNPDETTAKVAALLPNNDDEIVGFFRLRQAKAYLDEAERKFGKLPDDEPAKVQVLTAVRLNDPSELDKRYVRQGEKFAGRKI